MGYFDKMIEESNRRRADDAERFRNLDDDLCQICFAYGADKRSLILECGYAVYEAVPEAIDLFAVEGPLQKRGYYLRLCKSCRGSFLGHMEQWRKERVALRDRPKDHDGGLDDEDPERNIPVRINGAVVMMTVEQYEAWKERQR